MIKNLYKWLIFFCIINNINSRDIKKNYERRNAFKKKEPHQRNNAFFINNSCEKSFFESFDSTIFYEKNFIIKKKIIEFLNPKEESIKSLSPKKKSICPFFKPLFNNKNIKKEPEISNIEQCLIDRQNRILNKYKY